MRVDETLLSVDGRNIIKTLIVTLSATLCSTRVYIETKFGNALVSTHRHA